MVQPAPAEQAAWAAAAARPPLSAWGALLPGPRVDVAALDRLCREAVARDGIARPALREQTPALLADGLHYESRIARDGVLATRTDGVHDLFNALIWLRHPALKWALNARQVADIERVGPRQRTRGQCALTHFDEAGAIVWIADESLLARWDAHDWIGLFHRDADAWGRRIAVTVFGHALLEHAVRHAHRPTAKALAVRVEVAALAAHALAADALVGAWPEPEAALARTAGCWSIRRSCGLCRWPASPAGTSGRRRRRSTGPRPASGRCGRAAATRRRLPVDRPLRMRADTTRLRRRRSSRRSTRPIPAGCAPAAAIAPHCTAADQVA